MAYISQVGSFQALQVFTASHINQTEDNIRSHIHGQNSVSDQAFAPLRKNWDTIVVSADNTMGAWTTILSYGMSAGRVGSASIVVADLICRVTNDPGVLNGTQQFRVVASGTAQANVAVMSITWGGTNAGYSCIVKIRNTGSLGQQIITLETLAERGAGAVKDYAHAGNISSIDTSVAWLLEIQMRLGQAGAGSGIGQATKYHDFIVLWD